MKIKKIILTLGIFLSLFGLISCSSNNKEDKKDENLTYNVYFSKNGHGKEEIYTIYETSIITQLATLTDDEYIFLGWYYDIEFSNPASVGDKITSDVTLYAKWTLNTDVLKYTVTFNTNGGSSVASLEIIADNLISAPSNPTKEGFEFAGWYKEKALTTKWNFTSDKVTSNITLYAKWTSKKINVSFDTQGGTSIDAIEINKGTTITKPADPTKEGYEFVGWKLNGEDFNFNTTVENDITLIAVWKKVGSDTPEKITYTVTFDTDGGTTIESKKIEEGQKVSKPANPTKDGYKFDKWLLNGEEFNFETPINSNITLTASYVIADVTKYTVTFDTQGGTTVVKQEVEEGQKVTKPATDPVKNGYKFIGWYNGNTLYDFNLSVTSNITLVAKWEKKEANGKNTINFPFAKFSSEAANKSLDGKTTEDITIDGFIVYKGVKYDNAMLNTQGKNVDFTLNGTVSNSIKVIGIGGSSTGTTEVKLQKLSGSEYVDVKVFGTAANKESITCELDNLEAGQYRLSTSLSFKITTFTLIETNEKEDVVDIFTVTFNSNGGTTVENQSVASGGLATEIKDITKEGYTFLGWYLNDAKFDFNTPVTKDITLVAKWEQEKIPDNAITYTIKFVTNCDTSLEDRIIVEGKKITAPNTLTKEGYMIDAWYTDESFTNQYDFNKGITQNLTLYAKWVVAEYRVSFVGTNVSTLVEHGKKVTKPSDPVKSGYEFVGWYTTNSYETEFDFINTVITKNTSIYAKFNKIASDGNIDDMENGSGQVGTEGTIKITSVGASMESAYIVFNKVNNSKEYDIYLNINGNLTKVDEKIAYCYEYSSNSMRVDFLGLAAGSYEAMVVPKGGNTSNGSYATFNVIAYDRSGYAHFNYSEGVGAYNDDGTLKDNAIVLYVTDDNKNTVELNYNGKIVKGIGNILNSVGKECGEPGHEGECKKVSKGKAYYGIANTNAGILEDLASADIPLVVRFIGCVSNTGLYKQGTFNANSKTLIEGLTAYDSNDYGGTEGDNGHMARMKSGKNITLEGVGSEAVIDGWGFHFMCESAKPDLAKNFEVRNLTFINTPEDAIGMEGVQEGNVITASVERCWVHNNEFYSPSISSPAESDKSEGDGSCDFKRGEYFTLSYNYFEGCHKTNLIGSADDSLQYNITMHHNHWKLCAARGPLVRNSNVHMYNNLFEQQTDYAMNPRANAYIYSEYNMFYMCKNPQQIKSGAIKSFNDSFSSCIGSVDGTIVTDKSQTVSNSCKYAAKNIDYSKFDTDSKQSYIPSNNYELQENVTDARKVIFAYGGVRKEDNIAPKDVTLEDIDIITSKGTVNDVKSYPTTLAPGKIEKTTYAFKIDRSATVTVKYDSDAAGTTGILVNLAGECMLTASGSVVLSAGTYYIQPDNFQPGKNGGNGVFKSVNIVSISFEEYNSTELDQKLIDEYNTALAQIPKTIEYNKTCLNAIKKAMSLYNNLSPDLKAQVDYDSLNNANNTYISLGETYVETLISQIGDVNENSGNAITTARREYNELNSYAGTVNVSNYQTLVAAEKEFASYAVTYVIKKIDELGTITLASETAIESARNAYESLSDDDKAKVTNYQTLVAAEKELTNLIAISEFEDLIMDVDMTNISSMKEVIAKYNTLTTEQKNNINSKEKLSSVKVNLTIKLIDSIGKVSTSSGPIITEAENSYNSLSAEEKAKVSNYQTLVNAKNDYEAMAPETYSITFANKQPVGNTEFFTVSGNYSNGSALKLESSAGNIKFSVSKSCVLKVYDVGSGKNIKINGKIYDLTNKELIVELTAGTYEITKGNGSAYISKVEVIM